MARRRRRGRKRIRPKTSLRRAFSGGLVRGRMHPSTTSGSPWNNYVLTTTWKATGVGLQCIAVDSIEGLIKTELGIEVAQKIDIRVLRIDIWTPPAFANSDVNYIVCAPADWTDKATCANRASLNWYEAWGTAVQPANLHYVWPKSISTQVIQEALKPIILTFDISKATMSYLLKLHLQWRVNTPDLRPVQSGQLVPTHFADHPPSDYVYIQGQGSAGTPMCN